MNDVLKNFSPGCLYGTEVLHGANCNWMSTNGFKVKIENDWFIFVCPRCRQNLKFGDLTLLFCGVGQRNALKFSPAARLVFVFSL